MPRYVDSDALWQKLPDDLPFKASVKRVLMQAQPADVVEVVRCKDCKHLKHSQSVLNGELECGYCRLYANYLPSGLTYRGGNDYCSYGERRER